MSMMDPKLSEDIASDACLTFLDRAVPLIERGFEVIPILPKEKRPCGSYGPLSRTRDGATIQSWQEQFPQANVAIVSNDEFCILESDDLAQFAQLIKNVTGNDLPQTLTACGSSENRPHFFFEQSKLTHNVGNLKVPGLFECRFHNQYVVGPGSVHPNGSIYRFLNDSPVIPIPDWLVSGLVHLAQAQKTERRNPSGSRNLDGKVVEGGRHYELFSALGKQWNGEREFEELLEWARAWNEHNCEPPMEDSRVVNDVRDIMKLTPHVPGPKVVLGSPGAGQPTEQPAEPTQPKETWSSMSVNELALMDIPDRNAIVCENGAVLFYEASINQILAWRGVGKTNFGLGLADAIAGGGQLLDFKTDKPRQVLYVDGELPLKQLQERVQERVQPHNRSKVQLLNPEMLTPVRGMNLLDPRDFDALRDLVERNRTEVLVLDSQNQLMKGDSNDPEFHEHRQEVLRALRWMGLCVIEMHHTGKSGLQRGISRNDDILDVQIHLKKVADWEAGDGLLFELGYEKVRHAAALTSGYLVTLEDGQWAKRATDEVKAAAELFQEGKTEREVARALKCSNGKAHKLRNQAMKAGLLKPTIALGVTGAG
jgi:Bifunctional DNA primase/polymerase, N-terminal/AAA domain